MRKLVETDKRKIKKLVEGSSFDLLILSLIVIDAMALGLMASDIKNIRFDQILFVLDRLCMAIFVIEMLMKIYAYGLEFFKKGWNVFDFTVVFISSIPFANYFIILRTFRLFRALKYINRFSHLKNIVDVFATLIPNFLSMLAVFAVFFYVFAIISVYLYGGVFVEFSTLSHAGFTMLQVFTLDGWASNIARPVMSVFPNAWMFFVSFVFVCFLIVISFILSAFAELSDKTKPVKAKKK